MALTTAFMYGHYVKSDELGKSENFALNRDENHYINVINMIQYKLYKLSRGNSSRD